MYRLGVITPNTFKRSNNNPTHLAKVEFPHKYIFSTIKLSLMRKIGGNVNHPLSEQDKADKAKAIDGILSSVPLMEPSDFDVFIAKTLSYTEDQKVALQEIDHKLVSAVSQLLYMSSYLNQKYRFAQHQPASPKDKVYLKRADVAKRFDVDVRTVTAWCRDGLKQTQVGGTVRIAEDDLQTYVETKKGKKFNWRSLARYDEE